MHKTVYIDIDEEIIGIIRKIRQAETQEVFLVVPKNSLLTQGIVNLKLLKKEVEKMGKEVILVTSDKHSREIIEKMGLKTKNKSVQDFVGGGNQTEENLAERKIKSEEFSYESTPQASKKRVIGSSSFYNFNEEENVENEMKFEFDDNPEDSSVMVKPNKETRKIQVNQENSFGEEYIKNREFKNKVKEENNLRELNFSQNLEAKPESEEIKPVREFDFITQSKAENSENNEDTIKDFYESNLKNRVKKEPDHKKNKSTK